MYRFLNYFSIITFIALFGTNICSIDLNTWHRKDKFSTIPVINESLHDVVYFSHEFPNEKAKLKLLLSDYTDCTIKSKILGSYKIISEDLSSAINVDSRILILMRHPNHFNDSTLPYYLLVISAVSCDYKFVNLNIHNVRQIIPRTRLSFDILYTENSTCEKAITYEIVGFAHIEKRSSLSVGSFRKVFVNKVSFYSTSSPTPTTLNINKLNSDYKIEKTYTFNDSTLSTYNLDLDIVAVEHERFTICFPSKAKLRCFMFDADLNKLNEVTLGFSSNISSVSVRNGPNGDAFVSYESFENSFLCDRFCRCISVVKVNTKGVIGHPLQLECEDRTAEHVPIFSQPILATRIYKSFDKYCVHYCKAFVSKTKCYDSNYFEQMLS